MPVNFGFRDEENERINNVLKQLTALALVPEDWNEKNFDAQLQKLTLSLETLVSISAEELVKYLNNYHFDYANMEQFADVLATLSKKAGYEGLKQKAVMIYTFIQQDSKQFSFIIFNKINNLN
jgi:hypothetical protein